jgi:hypothetical protein
VSDIEQTTGRNAPSVDSVIAREELGELTNDADLEAEGEAEEKPGRCRRKSGR